MVKDGSGTGRIVLKGCEAAGFVSGETTLVLYSTVKEMLHASAKDLDILIWGGVSTPEAAAAFLSTGAAGIVFESVHWLTDLVVMDDLPTPATRQTPHGFHCPGGLGPAGSVSPFQQGELAGLQKDSGVRGGAVRRRDHGRKPSLLRRPGAGQRPTSPGQPFHPERGHPSGRRRRPLPRRLPSVLAPEPRRP